MTITCGNIEGKFYIAKFKKGIPSSKCVIHNSVWCSLVEFESYGGKSKSKNWKRSIKHNNVGIGSVLDAFPNLSSISNCPSDSHPNSASGACQVFTDSSDDQLRKQPSLYNAVLTFIKAFRMKGDTDSLKQALGKSFYENEVANALKILWDSSSSVLESSGFTYHQRRGSEKCPVAELVIKDILSAFDKLDSSESIPPMYCEASDLLKLPPIATDMPIATVQESNLRIKDLQTDVQVSNNNIRDLKANLNNLTFSNQATRLESLKESLF